MGYVFEREFEPKCDLFVGVLLPDHLRFDVDNTW